jgi:tetratricopeptide (TPR) repeat protein
LTLAGVWATALATAGPAHAEVGASPAEGRASTEEADRDRLDALRAFADAQVREALAATNARIDERLTVGDPEGAAREADVLLNLAADDPAVRLRALSVLGLAPSRRAEAIAAYREIVRREPEHLGAWLAMAKFLSWSPGRLPEAIEAYRRAHALDPDDHEGALGLARTLAWAGINAEATRRLDRLIRADPRDGEALLARAQLARWTGHPRLARDLLHRAGEELPDDPRVLAEHARILADAGRRTEARREALAAQASANDLYEAREALAAIHDATATRLRVRATASRESSGMERIELALPVEAWPLADTRVQVEPGWGRFTDGASADRATVGVAVRQEGLPQGLFVGAHYRLQQLLGEAPAKSAAVATVHAFGVEVGAVRPLDLPLRVRAGARRRALIDPPGEGGDVAPLVGVGAGGTTLSGLVDGLQTSEAWATTAGAPFRGAYVYAHGALGFVDDGNATRALAAGLGHDLMQGLATPSPFTLTVKNDVYLLGTDQRSDRYYSPSTLFVDMPGLAAGWRPREGFELGVQGGLPIRDDGRLGWLAGAWGRAGWGERLYAEARVQAVDTTTYRLQAATVGIGGSF